MAGYDPAVPAPASRCVLLALLLAGCPPALGDDDDATTASADDDDLAFDDDDSTDVPDEDGDGYTPLDGDCDDADPQIHPGADEVCDPLDRDEDCDGGADDDDPDGALGALTVWVDEDGDGFGRPGTATTLCDPPAVVALQGGDCDDEDPRSWPGAPLICDLRDNDCDGVVTDDGLVTITSSGATFTSVQAAIDAASPGATVSVCPGTYAEALTIGSGLVLEGLGGQNVTTVDAGGSSRVVDVTVGGVVLAGLTLTGGVADEGAGLRADGVSGVTLLSCTLLGNEASGAGGGLLVQDVPSVSLSDIRVLDNAAGLGGGVASLDSGGFAIDLIARANTAGQGGGLYVSGTVPTIENGLFELNSATTSGGGVRVAGDATLYDVDFFDNTAPLGASHHVSGGALTLEDGSVRRNVSASGGALLVETDAAVTNVSWGIGADDNQPGDVSVSGGGSYSYGALESFVCVGDQSPGGGTVGCQ